MALKQAERIEPVINEEGKVVKATWKIKEPYAGGQDIQFKATETSNIIPENVLISCPALVDAKDEAEIKNYLDVFRNAIDYSKDESKFKENDIEGEDVGEEYA